MCPTGALKSNYDIHGGDNNSAYHPEETEKQELFFFSSLCTGCGLCSDFCVNNSISIKQGFPGEDPFKITCVRRVLLDEEEHDTIDEEDKEINNK
jgi:ferredoxin